MDLFKKKNERQLDQKIVLTYFKDKKTNKKQQIIAYCEDNKIKLLDTKQKLKHEINIPKSELVRHGDLAEDLTDKEKELSFQINEGKDKYVFIFDKFDDFNSWLTQLGLIMKTVGTYGYPLRVACLKSAWRYPIPFYRSIQYIRYNGGLETEGIFRVSPNFDEKQFVLKILNSDSNSGEIDFQNIRIASGCCKDYLSSLDNPIIPYTEYDKFLMCSEEQDQKKREHDLRKLVEHLPLINQNCLWYLIDLLYLIHLNREKTLMSASNLAVVFTPSCVRNPLAKDPLKSMNDIKVLQVGFETLISSYPKIFKNIKNDNENI